MGRLLKLAALVLASVPAASAQITSRGTQSVPDLMSHLFGIEFHEPYVALGFASTIGVLWVATYVIFKIGIKRIDAGLDNDGYNSGGFAEALGIDSEESRNILSVLTLLIVLTMLGTGAFAGLIQGWQSLILLAFTFALLAGTIFVIIGGTGGVIGGSAYVAGASAKVTAQGVNQMQEAVDEIGGMENQVDAEEDEEEDDIDDGNDDEADNGARVTEEELEEIIGALNDSVDDMNNLMTEEINELGESIENLEELLELIDLED